MADIEKVVELAIRCAGDNSDPVAWRKRVLAGCMDVAGMLNEHSQEYHVARRVLDAEVKDSPTSVFHTTLGEIAYEERTTRYIVRFIDPNTGKLEVNDKGELIDMRTDRTDDLLGQVMAERVKAIPIGTKVRVWKTLEKSATDPNKKVRILSHIETMSSRDEHPSAQPAGPRAAAPPGGQPPEDSPSSGGGAVDARVPEALSRLTQPERVRVAKRAAQEHQIYDIHSPKSQAEAGKILVLCEIITMERKRDG